MKKLTIIIACLALFSCKKELQPQPANSNDTVTAADGVATPKPDTAKVLEETPEACANPIMTIRKRVEHINTTTLEKKHFEFMCDEKMMVDYFYENGEIVKIAVDFGTLGDVYAKEGYYYNNGKLVFNYEYVEGGPACDDCIKTNEYRTYVQNDKAIRYLKDKTETQCKTCSFTSTSRQYKLLKAKTQDEVKATLCR